MAPPRTTDEGRVEGAPLWPGTCRGAGGLCDKREGCAREPREPASAPEVLFVYEDVLMKCISSF